jgi:hypothetical protein
MPISTRTEGSTGGASNQIVSVAAALGAPDAAIGERIVQVRDSLKRGRTALSNLSPGLQMGYTVMLGAIMPNLVGPVAQMFASHSLMVSNITPPRGAYYANHPLYRAGARLEAYYIQPILNAGTLLNVTVMCYNGSLNVGIGSIPGSIDEPMRLGRYMIEALAELATVPESAEKAKLRHELAPSARKRPLQTAGRRNRKRKLARRAAGASTSKRTTKSKDTSASP